MNILSQKEVKTRKECTCTGCNRKAPVGSFVSKVTGIDGGVFYTSNWCRVCAEYWRKFMDYDDEISDGGLRDNDTQGWDKLKEELIEQEEISENGF